MANRKKTRDHRPAFRRLRVYAFDPSLETQLENAVINQVTLKVPWERDELLHKGPVGEYLEVIDDDPASEDLHPPVDLNDPHLLAQDGLPPSEGNPQFHQQMVYAVAMTTIRNFERALGRLALWSPQYVERADGFWEPFYVPRLRIYPHALQEPNAYYSPHKKALLFGYFTAEASDPAHQMPGGTVFTCLSHDVIVHETTHALLDGLHRRFVEPTNPDSLAFHEAFADIVALFQHFSQADVLRHQIARTRGDLARRNVLGELAYQFGRATGTRGALRSAIGTIDVEGKWQPHDPRPCEYKSEKRPHHRGSHLVAAVFDAFLAIYNARIADLLRIASGGTGRLPDGHLHPDLVNRLADEAAKTSRHMLNMCIRALDYCPPIDLTFGEYLRALITADHDLVRDDDRGYRIAMIEAFRRRGIYPEDVRTLSEDSLRWHAPDDQEQSRLASLLPRPGVFRRLMPDWDLTCDRHTVFKQMVGFQQHLEKLLRERLQDPSMTEAFHILGLDPTLPAEELKVDSMRPARRIGPDEQSIVELVVEITQRLPGYWDARDAKDVYYSRNGENGFEILRQFARAKGKDADFWVRGGCTILIDPDTANVRYAIVKNIRTTARFDRQADYLQDAGGSVRATYFGPARRLEETEAFAMLHRGGPQEALESPG